MATTVMPHPTRLAAHPLVAPRWHTFVLLIVLAVPVALGIIVQSRSATGSQVLAGHSEAMLRFYVPVVAYEWFLVLYVWLGIRTRGCTLRSLIGGRWSSWRTVALDVGLGLAMWICMLALGMLLSRVLGPGHAKAIGVLLPQSRLEIGLWVAIAATAGFVEELVYRGYLQTQFTRLGFPPLLAIIAQAIVFGLGHAYEGLNAVSVITAYALLFGALAFWRKSLRPGMIGHSWFDFTIIFLMRR